MAQMSAVAERIARAAGFIACAQVHRGVYFLVDGQEIVYVGQSINVLARIGQHVGERKFTAVAFYELKRDVAPVTLTTLERYFLQILTPRHNRDGVSRKAKQVRASDPAWNSDVAEEVSRWLDGKPLMRLSIQMSHEDPRLLLDARLRAVLGDGKERAPWQLSPEQERQLQPVT